MTCGRCTASTPDGHTLCARCADDLRHLLALIPDTLADAEDTIARLTSRNSGPRTAPAEQPAPINLDAAQRRDELTDLIESWAHLIRDETNTRGHGSPYLTTWLPHITRQDWAPDLTDELTKAHRRLHAAVDRHPDRRTLGPCQYTRHDGTNCTGTIRGTTTHQTARCTTCGTTYDAAELIRTAVANAWDHAAPLATITTALRTIGLPIPLRTAQSWVRRGHLAPTRHRADGTALYTMAQLWQTRASLQQPTKCM